MKTRKVRIEVFNEDGSCFEAIEIKHGKAITSGMIGLAFRKIKSKPIERYYLLTTSEPNVDDAKEVARKISELRNLHQCQIIINGVLPSLKYYMRLVSEPERFVDLYTEILESEFKLASGIKSEHLKVWAEIRKTLL